MEAEGVELGAKVPGAVGCLAWMLGAKLCSSGRAAGAGSHGAGFLALTEEILTPNSFIVKCNYFFI